ncbi:MAG: hypothetical protein IJI66_10530 [Erysipelotrichaceae bacterium]|nr:hypothetical protein [Erysipelotrichaceae bacterium]
MNRITFQDLLRMIKKGKFPKYIRFMNEIYEYSHGNYYSHLTDGDLAEYVNKYPSLLLVNEKMIEIPKDNCEQLNWNC